MTEPDRPRLCGCECGEPIPLAPFSNASMGYVKGRQTPARFLRGHNARAAPPWWKGDAAGYGALHRWLRAHYPKAGTCEQCGKAGPTDYSLIKGRQHGRNRADYRELCRKCHVAYDGNGGSRWRGVETARDRAGPDPGCRCQCGGAAGWDRKHARWRKYAAGHH